MNADLQQKKKRKENESSKRSPLLDFNKIPKFTTKRSNTSAASSSSSSSSIGASKSCLRVLLSSNNSSSKSSPRKKPTSFFSAKSGNLRSNSSKENVLPRPISEKSKKKAHSFYQWQSGKKPVSRTYQKSKILPDPSNSGKNPRSGPEKFALNREGLNLKRAEPKNGSGKQPIQLFNLDNSVSSFENRTPVGKLGSGSGLDCGNNFVGEENLEEESNGKSNPSIVKTPPIEASLSPEIPYGLSAVLASAKTPCYGAGHVLSGVTDKRKCRPRGVLTVGPVLDSSLKRWKADESNKEIVNSRVVYKSRTSFVPLPAEASMCWLSSPCGEGDGTRKSGSASQFPGLMGSATLEKNESFVMDNSPHSTSTLSCGNVIQTPKSDSTSALDFGLLWHNLDEHHKQPGFEYELDEVTEILGKARLSPQNQMPTHDAPEMSFKFTNSTSSFGLIGIDECQKRRDAAAAASLLSDSSFGNASESNMRISWRDGLVGVSRTIEMDELDRCRCLSDEENDNVYEENDVVKSVLKSPELLKEEPRIYKNGKEKLSPQRPSSCAESIFTDGGGLVSSADSDWTLCCKSQQFRI